jgi:ribosomal protein L28
MAKSCEVCGKTYQRANLVPRGIGNRVTRRTTTKKGVNLRVKRMTIKGTSIKIRLCASCLKRMKFDSKKALDSENQAAK